VTESVRFICNKCGKTIEDGSLAISFTLTRVGPSNMPAILITRAQRGVLAMIHRIAGTVVRCALYEEFFSVRKGVVDYVYG